MRIVLKNGLAVPIYEQIKDSIKENIITTRVGPGERLPSVRNLSKDLGVSILTVKKAYDFLEEEGFIESRQGLGTFVSEDDENIIREEVQKSIEDGPLKAIELSKKIDLDKKTLFELFDYLYEGGGYEK